MPFRQKQKSADDFPVIEKIVDGQIINCVDVDALSQAQRMKYFERSGDH